MKKAFVTLFFLLCLNGGNYAFGQSMEAYAQVLQNDFGKVTFIFTHDEVMTKTFFLSMKKLFEDEGRFIFPDKDLSMQQVELAGIFLMMYNQFYDDLENKPDTFELLSDVDEDQLTNHQITVLSLEMHQAITKYGLVEYVNFVYITTSEDDEVLFCNIGE